MLQLLKNVVKNQTLKFKYRHNHGYCPICEKKTIFIEFDSWLRDNYKCAGCLSIPRNRALVRTLNLFAPDWKKLVIHESSASAPLEPFFKNSAPAYTASQYYDDVPRGDQKGQYRSEDISNMTFEDNSFDLFITSDVFEHVFEPEKAFSEIARVLKPGGMHIFTMPWYPEMKESEPRAYLKDGKVFQIKEPIYHGNPVSEEGSLVTFDWGLDFCDIIYKSSGMTTTIYVEKNRDMGLDAAFSEVFISRKY
jgi:SAM-dependent methyltransferase